MALATEPALSILATDPKPPGWSIDPPQISEKEEPHLPISSTANPRAVEKEGPHPPISSTAPPRDLAKEELGLPVSSTELPVHDVGGEPNPPVSSIEPLARVEKDTYNPSVSSTEPPIYVEKEEPHVSFPSIEPLRDFEKREPHPLVSSTEPSQDVEKQKPDQPVPSLEPSLNVGGEKTDAQVATTEPLPQVVVEQSNIPVSSIEPLPQVAKEQPNLPASSIEPLPQVAVEQSNIPLSSIEPLPEVAVEQSNIPVSSIEPLPHALEEQPNLPVSSTEPPSQVEGEEDKFDHTIIPFQEFWKDDDSRNVPWYRKEVGEISPAGLDMLENYSKIAPDNITRHLLEVRDRAWDVWPYPCIGNFLFLDLTITEFDFYPQIIKRLKEGQSFLDIGCCFAQDLRKLVHDGAPSENLYGSDLEAGFLDLGYELFLDKDTLKSHFFPANALDPDSPLKDLNGKIDIIYAGFFFHLFSFDQSLGIVERFIQILKPQKGSLICGKQSGCTTADTELQDFKAAGKLWRHNAETWTQLWEEAGRRTGTKWRINASLVDDGVKKAKWSQLNRQWLYFEIEREE